MGWIDTIVVSVIVIVGLIILYKALKEPLDLLFGGLGKILGYGRDRISGIGQESYGEIVYG